MQSRIPTLAVLALLFGCRTPSDPQTVDPSHQPGGASGALVGKTTNTSGVVTEDVMLARLEEVAAAYPDAIIERLALFDLAFPKDAAESAELGGFTVVLVTATTQDPEELPPTRLYVACGDEELDAIQVVWRKALIEESWAVVVGPFRFDGLFLIPLQVVGMPECKLMMDWAKNRSGQTIGVFDAGIPPDVVVMPPVAPPTEAAVRTMVEREYPFVVTQ